MKRALQVLVALSIVTMFIVNPVAAATSQGLEWGFAFGDKFDYTLTSTYEEGWGEGLYLNITAMPSAAIGDPLNTWSSIPEPSLGFWWTNGSSMGFSALIFLGIFLVGGKFAVPIGNFTHIEGLAASVLTGEEIIDEANVWGIEWSQDINATQEYRATATYSKVDGFLADYSLETWDTAENELVESIAVQRDDLPSAGLDLSNITQLLMDNILYVGIGVGVLILLAIICKKK